MVNFIIISNLINCQKKKKKICIKLLMNIIIVIYFHDKYYRKIVIIITKQKVSHSIYGLTENQLYNIFTMIMFFFLRRRLRLSDDQSDDKRPRSRIDHYRYTIRRNVGKLYTHIVLHKSYSTVNEVIKQKLGVMHDTHYHSFPLELSTLLENVKT